MAWLEMPQALAAEPVANAAAKRAFGRPDAIPFPPDNPYTDAKAGLGATLFFDPRLSGTGTVSCATCHNPALSWKDGLERGVGHDAQRLGRATPTLLDLAWADLLMWDGRFEGLEEQVAGPIGSAAEMDQRLDALPAKLAVLPGYRVAFETAFGSPEVTLPRVKQAVATFERTLVSNKAPFDRWLAGDDEAITAEARRGFALFTGRANCASCHSGWRFTDDGFHDIGLPSPDMGRGATVPHEPSLQHTFKTPTLRNIARRAPYMHDGSVASLAEVVRHYDTGFIGRPTLAPEMHRLGLSAQDADDLVAFMRTLTSQDDPITPPTLPTKDD